MSRWFRLDPGSSPLTVRSGLLLSGTLLAALVSLQCSPQPAPPVTQAPQATTQKGPVLADSPALQAAFIDSRQAEGAKDPAFHFRDEGRQKVARHPQQNYVARLDGHGLRVEVGGDSLALSLRSLACGDAPQALAPVEPTSDKHRAQLERKGLREWYKNGPLGIEQGFDLDAAPCADADRELRLDLALAGSLRPRAQGADIAFYRAAAGPTDRPVLHYGALFVNDADGKLLPAHFDVASDRLAIVVEAADAKYPLHIDPLFYVEEQILTASNKAANAFFGASVSLSSDGNRALVGAPQAAPGAVANAGAAYVYTRGGTGMWTEEAILTASNKAAGDLFGYTVSLSGDGSRALVGSPVADPGAVANAGAAYAYTRGGTGMWTEEAILTASNKATGDNFGVSVSLSGDGSRALVGARSANPGAVSDAGAAYVFTDGKPNGTACATAAECKSGFCADGVCCDTACGGSSNTDCMACSSAKGAATNGTCGTTQAAANFVCRASVGACDVADKCDGTGTTCPGDAKQPSSFTCRNSGGPCDVAENCDGSTDACPMDAKQPNTFTCRGSAGVCDVAENCDGTTNNCPADAKKSSTTVCRAAVGACDAAELCDGSTNGCPPNLLKPAGTMCKAAGASATCDPADFCDGARSSCPANFAPYGTSCGTALSCNGTGRCL